MFLYSLFCVKEGFLTNPKSKINRETIYIYGPPRKLKILMQWLWKLVCTFTWHIHCLLYCPSYCPFSSFQHIQERGRCLQCVTSVNILWHGILSSSYIKSVQKRMMLVNWVEMSGTKKQMFGFVKPGKRKRGPWPLLNKGPTYISLADCPAMSFVFVCC